MGDVVERCCDRGSRSRVYVKNREMRAGIRGLEFSNEGNGRRIFIVKRDGISRDSAAK